MFKKIIAVLAVFAALFACGCKKESKLMPFVSELRAVVYEGKTENYAVSAHFGFTETPRNPDGIVGEIKNRLTVSLKGADENVKITASLDIGGKPCTETFTLSPVTFLMTAEFPADSMPNEFDVTLTENGKSQTVTMRSIVPEGTLTYKDALKSFEEKQPEFIKNYEVGNTFRGEISLRILVNDGKAYWYVGLTGEDGKIKALLIDGADGELLAVKDIF